MLEGYRNEAYLDGIPDPHNPNKFISAAKFYSLPEPKQEKLIEICRDETGKKPITTVGIGANIEPEEVRIQLDLLFKEPGLMDKVYLGQAVLTDAQVELILKDDLIKRLIELKYTYENDWGKLRANEKISILSLYFNNRTLVDNRSNFRQAITNYIRTNNQAYLKEAVNEVIHRSNRGKVPGIQNRRDAEGELLASFKCPTYTKPNESADRNKVTSAQIGKTIIPLNNGADNSRNKNSDYLIWRTSMDHKVRQEHAILEGKIFRKDNPPTYMPGTMHNCRCYVENVPDYIVVNDPIAISKAFDLYLRKGITNPVLMLSGLDCR